MRYTRKIKILSMTVKDALDVLELSDAEKLDEATLKNAYRQAALKHHPDKGGSVEKMQEVNKAYDLLKNKELPQQSAKVDWEEIRSKYKKAGQIVIENLKKDFKPEIFSEYFQKQTGKTFTVNYSFQPSPDARDPHYSGIKAIWTSEDKETSFTMDTGVDLHDVVWPKPTLTGEGSEDIGYSMWIVSEIFHENRKVKFKRSQWDRTQLKSVLYDPEKIFPSKKIATMMAGKEKTRAFSRRDMYLGISKKLEGQTTDEWAYIPFGANKDFKLAIFRTVWQRKYVTWSPVDLRLKKAPHTRWTFKSRIMSLPESEKLLDVLADLQKKMVNETDGEKIKDAIESSLSALKPSAEGQYSNRIHSRYEAHKN